MNTSSLTPKEQELFAQRRYLVRQYWAEVFGSAPPSPTTSPRPGRLCDSPLQLPQIPLPPSGQAPAGRLFPLLPVPPRGQPAASAFPAHYAAPGAVPLTCRVRTARSGPFRSPAKDGPAGDSDTLVLHSIDPATTRDQLYTIFSEFGQLRAVRLRPEKKHLSAIVEFQQPLQAERALAAVNGRKFINSRKVFATRGEWPGSVTQLASNR
eukprot:TRINITY_DN73395_c0_g1_i1.p1 TRINITY_DN73395_c0_g1~~TRINITY_DN73395_c0_g1_i1.p1  ORF type:complete len:219 (+),score=17.92 TRINITY_DN73395_c0_g1_i1:33-659(+)